MAQLELYIRVCYIIKILPATQFNDDYVYEIDM